MRGAGRGEGGGGAEAVNGVGSQAGSCFGKPSPMAGRLAWRRGREIVQVLCSLCEHTPSGKIDDNLLSFLGAGYNEHVLSPTAICDNSAYLGIRGNIVAVATVASDRTAVFTSTNLMRWYKGKLDAAARLGSDTRKGYAEAERAELR